MDARDESIRPTIEGQNEVPICRRLDRRRVLQILGIGGVTAAASGITGAGVAGSAQQVATPAPVAETVSPAPTGPTIADKAADLAWDVEQIFRFVADDVQYDAYPGALRGSKGTLWGLAGNSVDQALLLAALLDEAVVPYRFAIGELDDQTVANLLEVTQVDPERAKARAASVLLPPDVASKWSGSGPWQRPAEIDQLLDLAQSHLTESIRVIEDALAGVDVALPEAAAALPERERRQHVWVQYADGADWIDLDPSLPETEPGKALATPTETLDELADDLYHGVTVRLVAEVVSGGQPSRTELLTYHARSADLAGIPLTLAHPSAEWLGISAAITGTQGYVPTLIVGDQIVEGPQIAISSGEGALGALGDEGAAEGQALAEWLEVEVSVPDQPARQAARTLFDRIDPQQRAAGAVDLEDLPPVTLTDIPEVGKVFVPMAGITSLAVMSQEMPWSYFAQDPSTADDQVILAGVSHGLPYLRDVLRFDRLADLGYHFYADEPNVVAIVAAPSDAQGQEDQRVAVAADILLAHHAAVPLAGATPNVAPGLLAGALDHAAERMLIEGTFSTLADVPDAIGVSVGRVFEVATEEGIPIRTLLPDQDASGLDIDAGARAKIAEALAAGKIVIVPEKSVSLNGSPRSGWWEVDSTTGQTIDRMDDGRGVDLVEVAVWIHHVFAFGVCFFGLGMAIGFVIRAAQGEVQMWGAAYGAALWGGVNCAVAFSH